LRERAVSDPRAAEILRRWLQRPRVEERVGGVDLDSMSERELERLHAGLLKLASLPEEELRVLIASSARRHAGGLASARGPLEWRAELFVEGSRRTRARLGIVRELDEVLELWVGP
jgi:hypothetical protein